jgi:putative membrane-bound dehydrogenase-like protein
MARVSVLFLIVITISCSRPSGNTSGLLPAEALRSFELPEGFQIELIAAEPLVADPVAMEVDEQGNFYVVEMHGYPENLKSSGVVKLLKDTNNDGLPDKSEVFADSLTLPTGIMKWKKGVIVTDVPNVWYLEDTNGDDHADVKKLLLTGFALTNPQHIANTPLLGVDNWIYMAHQGRIEPKVSMLFNDTGSRVHYPGVPGAPQLPRDANGRNIRFKPDTYGLEMLSGESQYGHTFDPWGHHLCTSNADHLFHEVIGARYLNRNPDLLVADATQNIPDHGDAAEVYPITKNPQHQLLTDVGVITSSCGVTWYQGDHFPDSFQNVTFIAEPVHNLVHADRIQVRGATFSAARVYQQKEFLASTDPWFRPVQFYIGPDGALYVIDYYRQIVEHPEWMSEEVNRSGALYNGSDKGRIYRISLKGSKTPDWMKLLKGKEYQPEELVSLLAHKNIWWRKTAQRLLSDRRGSYSAELLSHFLDTTRSATGYVHALWLLEDLSALPSGPVLKGLGHSVAGVRENAIRVAEHHLNEWPDVQSRLMAMGNDADPQVRFQLLCTLGELQGTQAADLRRQLLIKDMEDDWVQVAALSAASSPEEMITALLPMAGKADGEGAYRFIEKAAALVALGQQPDKISNLLSLALRSSPGVAASSRAALLSGFLQGFSVRKNSSPKLLEFIPALSRQFDPGVEASLRSQAMQLYNYAVRHGGSTVPGIMEKAVWVAGDTASSPSFRADAFRLLINDSSDQVVKVLEKAFEPSTPEAVQLEAVRTYNRISPSRAGQFYIGLWPSLSPGIRDAALEVYYHSAALEHQLLEAVERGKIPASNISWPRTVWLMNEDDEKVRSRARKLLAAGLGDRDAVVKKYAAALKKEGDPGAGHQLFIKNCAVCHQMSGSEGTAFGPDLASVRNRDAEFIMADILNPNRSIADKYELWTITTRDGSTSSGIISSETSSTITLTFTGGQRQTLSRSSIASMQSSSTSAMPAGFENTLSIEDMANLLAYLKGVSYNKN